MFRKMVCAVFVMTVVIGVVGAEEFFAQLTKVDGDKVTFQKFKKGEKGKKGEKDGDEATLPLAKDAKIVKGKFDPEAKKLVAGDAIEGGLKADAFKIDEKKGGPFVRITTAEDNKSITHVMTFGTGFKDKGKKDGKDKDGKDKASPKDAPAKDAKDK
jgi:hypothetical protein